MITCITYGDKKYQGAGKLNLETARMHGADRTIFYGPKDLPLSFKIKNWRIYFGRSGWHFRWRGAGFWIWKSYVIQKTLSNMDEGDILIYSDAGSVYVNDLEKIINVFNEQKLNVMVFTLLHIEKEYTKRDAFILLNADTTEYTDTKQRIGTYIIIRKSVEASIFVDEWAKACRDYRMITDKRNVMGEENYPEYVAHRHDQSLLSIVAKKHGIKEYRDPSQYGNDYTKWSDEILERSAYPQIWYSTRSTDITTLDEFRRQIANPYAIEE